MIQMTTWPLKDSRNDVARCEWDGRSFEVRARSATTALARELVAAGCPDQPWEAYTPDGTRSLRGRSLHGWARKVVVELDRGGLRLRDYQENLRFQENG